MAFLPPIPVAQICDPHEDRFVVGHRRGVPLVVLEGTVHVSEIEITEDREVAAREVETRVHRERRFVALARFREAPGLAVDDAEFVVRDGLPRSYNFV